MDDEEQQPKKNKGGRPRGSRGFKHTAETRRKMSESAKKRYAAEGANHNSRKGTPLTITPEDSARRAEVMRQIWARRKAAGGVTLATKQKMSAAKKGRKFTEEHKAALREGQRKRWEKKANDGDGTE